jgi:hypothetical protein
MRGSTWTTPLGFLEPETRTNAFLIYAPMQFLRHVGRFGSRLSDWNAPSSVRIVSQGEAHRVITTPKVEAI